MEQPSEAKASVPAVATAETTQEEPTEEEVAMIFRAVQDTFDEETATIMKKKHNNDVDYYKASLLNKVLSRFLDEYPSLLVGNYDSPLAAALPRKKKKKIAEEEVAVSLSRGIRGAIAGPSFRRLPLEAIALISSYGDRLDQNNLSLTNKRNYGVINDRKRVTKRWPTRNNRRPPFQSRLPPLVNETNGRIIKVVFSLDHSRVAVLKEGVTDHFPGIIEVWDRDKGLLAKLVSGRFRPDLVVFSPNGQFLVYTFTNDNRGDDEEWHFTKVCYLPVIGTDEEPIVSVLSFDNKSLIKAAFINNAHFTFMTDRQEGVKLCWMWVDDGQVTVSPPTGIVHDPDHPHQPPSIVAASNNRGSPIVYVYDSEDRTMVFHDLDRDVLVKKNLPPDYPPFTRSITFSPDGNLLVACNKDGCLTVFDFSDVDRVEDIDLGQHHRTVRFPNNPGVIDSFYGVSVSFTPNTSRSIITADFSELVSDEDDDEDGGGGGLRIRFCCRVIDLKNNELISDGWDDSCWPVLVN